LCYAFPPPKLRLYFPNFSSPAHNIPCQTSHDTPSKYIPTPSSFFSSDGLFLNKLNGTETPTPKSCNPPHFFLSHFPQFCPARNLAFYPSHMPRRMAPKTLLQISFNKKLKGFSETPPQDLTLLPDSFLTLVSLVPYSTIA